MAERVIDSLITEFVFKGDSEGLSRMEKRLDSFTSKAKDAGKTVFGIGAAGTAAVVAMFPAIHEFEDIMGRISGAAHISPADLDSLRAFMKELEGREGIAHSINEIAAGAENLAKQGKSLEEVKNILPNVLFLANAEGISVEAAIDATTKAMGSYKVPAEDAARVTNLLQEAAAGSNASVEGLGNLFEKVGGLAESTGVPMKELAGIYATMRDNGVGAEQATTAIQKVITTLKAPSDAAKKAMKDMGVDYAVVSDLIHQGKLTDAVQVLVDAGMSQGDAIKLFGEEAGKIAAQFPGMIADIDATTESFGKNATAAEDASKRVDEGLPGSWKDVKDALVAAAVEMGDAGLTGALTYLMGKVSDAIRWFTNLDEGIKRTILWTVGIMAGLGALAAVITSVVLVVKGAAVILGFLAAAIGLVSVPVILAVAAIAALGGAIWYFWDEIKLAWAWIKDVFDGAVKNVKEAGANLRQAWTEIVVSWKETWDSISDYFKRKIDAVEKLWEDFKNFFSGDDDPVQDRVDGLTAEPRPGLFDSLKSSWNVFALDGDPVQDRVSTLDGTPRPGLFDSLKSSWNVFALDGDPVQDRVSTLDGTPRPGLFNSLRSLWNAFVLDGDPVQDRVSTLDGTPRPGLFDSLKSSWNVFALDGDPVQDRVSTLDGTPRPGLFDSLRSLWNVFALDGDPVQDRVSSLTAKPRPGLFDSLKGLWNVFALDGDPVQDRVSTLDGTPRPGLFDSLRSLWNVFALDGDPVQDRVSTLTAKPRPGLFDSLRSLWNVFALDGDPVQDRVSSLTAKPRPGLFNSLRSLWNVFALDGDPVQDRVSTLDGTPRPGLFDALTDLWDSLTFTGNPILDALKSAFDAINIRELVPDALWRVLEWAGVVDGGSAPVASDTAATPTPPPAPTAVGQAPTFAYPQSGSITTRQTFGTVNAPITVNVPQGSNPEETSRAVKQGVEEGMRSIWGNFSEDFADAAA